jgi:hypothetical protein
MKRIILLLFATVFLGFALYPIEGNAQMGQGYGPGYGMGPGMMGQGYGPGYGMGPGMMWGQGYGPGYGMGPGMMGGQGYGTGYGMGPGMMGPGYGYGQQYGPQYGQQYGPQYGRQYQQLQKPLDQNQAKQEVENYLSSMRNPNLKLGKIEEKGNGYQVNIVTKDGSLVDKILVDKNTGWMRSAY